MRLAGKTALITGGNSGIGLATARLFQAEGARVAITGRNRKTLDSAAAELGSCTLALPAVVKKFGKLDIVFANAGIAGATPVGQTSLASFEDIIRTNLTAVFFTVQATAAHLNPGASVSLKSEERR